MAKTDMNNEELAKYAAEIEGVNSIENPIISQENVKSLSEVTVGSIGSGEARQKLEEQAKVKIDALSAKTVEQEHNEREAVLQARNRSNGNGFLPINIEDLPSKGMFYPAGTRIHVKAATLGEIKHWSTTDETDLTSIDDALNSVLDACCYVSFPQSDHRYANWKDLLDIDRFYIILAIHDFTFPNDKNELKISVNETTDVVVKKDNIEFIKFSDKLMKYYNAQKRCFSFPVKAKCFEGGMMDIYLPCLGVSKWLKDYIQTRNQRQEGFDQDVITIASLLIPDYRGLNNDRYYALVDSTADWTAYEWALITKVRKVIETSLTPVLKYKDQSGVEKDTPLNFRGGIKAIFQPSLDIDL